LVETTLEAIVTSFKGRIALVTGAGSGIGAAAALGYARAGARGVILAGRRLEPLENVADQVGKAGATPLVVVTDIAKEDEVRGLVTAATAKFDRIDAAFNNAGIEGVFAPITDCGAKDFDETIAINLRGVWLSIKYQMAAMIATGGGAIVNTSSWLAHGAFPGSSIYSASKSALDGMIRALAQEGAEHSIRVNNVNPGIIDTPMLRRFGDDAAMRPFVEHTPLRRLGSPEDVAEAVVWLSSDAARFVTGQTLLVDGGYTIPGHRAWVAGEVSASTSKRFP
jgi:NAD(P)-dependent dehydrogenase (short-subunit alcohol dehydrogenase family)